MLVELNYPEPAPVDLDPAKTLLLIVDMENESCHPNGNRSSERVAGIIPDIVKLRDRVREAGGRVVHTQSVRRPDALEFTLFNNVIRKMEGTWAAEFVEALRPEAGEPVIVKYTHDCFYRTEMEQVLDSLGMHPGDARIIVTGIAARGCVQTAVMGFSVRDYYVYVPMDCTAQKEEKEILQAFTLFTGFGYRYNVTMTQSDLIRFNGRR